MTGRRIIPRTPEFFRRRCILALVFLVLGVLITGPVLCFYDHESVVMKIAFGLVIPAFPFVLLSGLSLARRREYYAFTGASLVGAAVGAVIGVAIPWGNLWWSVNMRPHNGADIGAGILLLSYPLTLPVLMIAMGAISEAVGQKLASSRSYDNTQGA